MKWHHFPRRNRELSCTTIVFYIWLTWRQWNPGHICMSHPLDMPRSHGNHPPRMSSYHTHLRSTSDLQTWHRLQPRHHTCTNLHHTHRWPAHISKIHCCLLLLHQKYCSKTTPLLNTTRYSMSWALPEQHTDVKIAWLWSGFVKFLACRCWWC